jgi:hypothetical protein
VEWFRSLIERAVYPPLVARRLAAMRNEAKRIRRETAELDAFNREFR